TVYAEHLGGHRPIRPPLFELRSTPPAHVLLLSNKLVRSGHPLFAMMRKMASLWLALTVNAARPYCDLCHLPSSSSRSKRTVGTRSFLPNRRTGISPRRAAA